MCVLVSVIHFLLKLYKNCNPLKYKYKYYDICAINKTHSNETKCLFSFYFLAQLFKVIF